MYESTQKRVVARLQALKGKWPEIARKARMPYKTVRNIADGTVKNPYARNVEKLDRYLGTLEDLQ